MLITGVYDSLLKIANSKGTGAGKSKQSIVQKLLVAAKGEEVRYLVRTLSQNLRVGAVRTSILTALARAMVLTPPSALEPSDDSVFYASREQLSEIKPITKGSKKKSTDTARDDLQQRFLRAESVVKKGYVLHPNYDHIADALVEVGLEGLAERLPLTAGQCPSKTARDAFLHTPYCRHSSPANAWVACALLRRGVWSSRISGVQCRVQV